MPKMKSNSGAKKRFKKTGTGKYKHKKTSRGHLLTKKSPKRKRHLRKDKIVDKTSRKSVQQMLPYK